MKNYVRFGVARKSAGERYADGGRRRVGFLGALTLAGVSTLALSLSGVAALAQVEELIVTADPVGLMEERSTESIFGLDRALVETPRSVSVISDTTMQRYSIEDIDDFITTTPSTFGNSFFGVPGAVSVRGDLGDNYFRGFKRVINNGFFPLPIGASERVEIVRGPTPAIYGAGRVGGLLNFYPKTTLSQGLTASDGLSGYLEYTGGRYNKNNVAAEFTAPFLLGGRETGLSLYAEYEDSKDFVRGREPQHELVQASFDHDFGGGFNMEFGGMYFNTEGYIQTAGWNRLTQELIDDGLYITGRDVDLVDLDGNGYITHNEADAVSGTFFGVSCLSFFVEFFIAQAFTCPNSSPASFYGPGTPTDLDVGVGTAKISPRDQVVSPFDVAEAENFIAYLDLIKEFDDESVAKLQFFYDDNDAKQGVAHGFAGHHLMDVFEVRGSYEFGFGLANVADVDMYLTASHRVYDTFLRENFLSGYVVLDRLDLSVGTRGNDVFDTPFTVEPSGVTCRVGGTPPALLGTPCNAPWDSAFRSKVKDTGVAIVTDIHLWEDLGILFNGRYDYYDFSAIDTGTIDFGGDAARFVLRSGNEDAFSYSISGSYDFDGIVPYVTYAKGKAPLENSAGGVDPGTIAGNGGILADSKLIEAGVKFELLDDSLFSALSFFKQERKELDILGNVLTEKSKGFEAELSWVVTDNWALTGAATVSKFEIEDPDPDNCPGGIFFGSGEGEFANIAPTDPVFFGGIPLDLGYGGIFRVLNASCLPELADGYEKEGIPNQVYSLFLTYTSDETSFGTFGATFGGTYVGETGTLPVADEVRFPDYAVFRLAAFAEYKNFSLIGTVDNLFDKEYFVSSEGTFQNVSVHPGRGRIWRVTGRVSF